MSNDDTVVIHTTEPIYNDNDPIWTIKTKSLCLLELPEDDTETGTVIVEICHGSHQCLGVVHVSFSEIRASHEERNEYPIRVKDGVAVLDTTNDGVIQVHI
jgi:hypothetical protein